MRKLGMHLQFTVTRFNFYYSINYLLTLLFLDKVRTRYVNNHVKLITFG